MQRDRAEREAITREIAEMLPDEFYAAWRQTLAERLERQGPRWRWHDLKPDEFGVTALGAGTPLGYRYHDMRARFRAELRAFEEARDAA